MRRTATACAVAAVLALLGSPAAAQPPSSGGTSAPQVASVIADAPPDGMVSVLVTLRSRADVSDVRGARPARLRAVVARLQARAAAAQAPIRAMLRTRAGRGEVGDVVPLWVVNAISVTATPAVVKALAARADVATVTSDQVLVVPATGLPEPNVAAVRAPDLWSLGQSGQGVVVATLDSGVDLSHPDLLGRWRGGTNSWYDPYGEHPATPTDASGHGTATMGLILGGDAGSTSIGVAPGATWIAARVFNDRGGATATALHQAFQWLLDPDHDPTTPDAPDVVNGSWSIGAGPGCDLAFQPDVQALRAAGILPVFAAGNFGPGAATSVSPANYPESLAVGAVNGNALVYGPSSRGPSTCGGRGGAYPDVVAPGVDVLTTDRYGLYHLATGTSVSAPHATGVLALLLGAAPGLPVDQQRAALTGAATDLGATGPDTTYGSGRLDALGAYQWAVSRPNLGVTVDPASAGVERGSTATFTVQVTPVNGFDDDVSLALSGPGASEATSTFTPAVVPSGSGTAQLSITPSSTLPPGDYPLIVSATGGSATADAPLALTVTIPPGTDLTGPTTSTPALTGTPTNGSADVVVHATADDTATGGSVVEAAEYFVDNVGATGTGAAMTVAAAGPVTDLTATVPTANLENGSHVVSVRGRDAAGNWGPVATGSLVVDKVRPVISALTATPNPTLGATTITMTGTVTDTSDLTRAEWFRGTDPGPGLATPMTITGTAPTFTLTTSIDVTTWNEGTHTLTVRTRDAAGNWSTPTTTTTVAVRAPIAFSTLGNTNPPGVTGTPDDADLYTWNGTTYTRTLDATTIGLTTGANLDGYDRLDATRYYVSFAGDTTVPGLGTVQDEDVLLNNAGTWSVFFDGTAHGLTVANLDLDAITITGTTLYFSTLGNTNPPGVGGTADDADIYSWNGTTYTRVIDATTLGLPATTNVDGYVRRDATHYLLSFSTPTTTVPTLGTTQDEDILLNTTGTWSVYFDGTTHGLTTDTLDIDAFDTP
ncbi:S8 family serine peptidase [Cellulomonas sp.]|uniref:S8 family serine peptidase n=1 Tax=Cellulomonas sp. TaxID=40001 RepID=UPI003BA846CB